MINGKSFSIVLYVMCDFKQTKKKKPLHKFFLQQKTIHYSFEVSKP